MKLRMVGYFTNFVVSSCLPALIVTKYMHLFKSAISKLNASAFGVAYNTSRPVRSKILTASIVTAALTLSVFPTGLGMNAIQHTYVFSQRYIKRSNGILVMGA